LRRERRPKHRERDRSEPESLLAWRKRHKK
jgi:hypothetical protein